MGMNNEEIMESGTIIIEMIFFFVAIHVLRSCFQLIWWLCTDFIPMTYGKIKRTSQSVCLGVTERMSRCHRAYVSVSQSVCLGVTERMYRCHRARVWSKQNVRCGQHGIRCMESTMERNPWSLRFDAIRLYDQYPFGVYHALCL